MVVGMATKCIIPTLKISRQILMFGSCAANKHKELMVTIENHNMDKLPIDLTFEPVSYYEVKPNKIVLNSG